MPGQTGQNSDFVTPIAPYRLCLTDPDSSVNDVTEIIDTTPGPNAQLITPSSRNPNQPATQPNHYGRNAQLSIVSIIQGFSEVKIQLWMNGEATLRNPVTPEESSSSAEGCDAPATGDWIFVEERTLARSALSVFKDIPPNQYKVVVSAKTGTGTITLREFHAA